MDFGISISPSSRIDLDKLKRDKWLKLVKIEPDALKCIACGGCCASCTGGVFTNVSLRSAILFLQNGKETEALKLLKGCMLCGKCQMICPRGINTRHLIISINKIYSDEK